MEGDGEPRFADGLHRLRLAEHARSRRDQDLLPARANRSDSSRDSSPGAAFAPSSRFVSTVSITVPSRSRCSGPVGLMGSVLAGMRRPPVDTRPTSMRAPAWHGRGARRLSRHAGGPVPRCRAHDGVRDVIEVGWRGRSAVAYGRSVSALRVPASRSASGCWPAGRRLTTTLPANRLSYSRRFRSASSGSVGRARSLVAGPAGRPWSAARVRSCACEACARVERAQAGPGSHGAGRDSAPAVASSMPPRRAAQAASGR